MSNEDKEGLDLMTSIKIVDLHHLEEAATILRVLAPYIRHRGTYPPGDLSGLRSFERKALDWDDTDKARQQSCWH